MRSLSSLCLIKSAITGERVSPENRFAMANRPPKKRVFGEDFEPNRRPLLHIGVLPWTVATNLSARREQRTPPLRRPGQNRIHFQREGTLAHRCLLSLQADPKPKTPHHDR